MSSPLRRCAGAALLLFLIAVAPPSPAMKATPVHDVAEQRSAR